MKSIVIFIQVLLTVLAAQAQMAELAWHNYSPKEYNLPWNEATNFNQAAVIPVIASKTIAESGETMKLYDFKKFGLYKFLIQKLKEECASIHSYKIVRESQRYDPQIYVSYSNKIDDEALNLVRKASEGDRYLIYDIQVRNSSGEIYRLPFIASAVIRNPVEQAQ